MCLLILTPSVAWAECSPEQVIKMLDVNLETEKIQDICNLKEARCSTEQVVKMMESNIEFDTIRRLCNLKEASCTLE